MENFKNDVSDSLKFYNLSNGYVGRPNWITDKSQIKGEWFYDSVIAKVNDIEIYGNVAMFLAIEALMFQELKIFLEDFMQLLEKKKTDLSSRE